jgi:hypothetical protein
VPLGGFGIDGDLLANTPLAGAGDWHFTTNFPGSGNPVLTASGAPIDPLMTFHFVDPFNSGDSVFSSGSKWTDDPGAWTWTTGKASAKTDINNVLLHITSDTNGHVWIIIAGDRRNTSGDSYIDFEFLQNILTRNTNGTFTSSGPDQGRTSKDVLLSLAFGGGGQVADFFAWQWQPKTNGGFEYVNVTASLPTGLVFAALNSNTVAAPFTAFGDTNYAPFAFAEAALDLTALIGAFDPCVSFGFKTIMVKTKASQSANATIEDFVDPIQYNVKLGPSADAGNNQHRCTEGSSTAFPLLGTATPGLKPIASTTWTVVDGIATIDSPTSLSTTAHVSSALATIRLTVVQSNGCSEAEDIELRVSPLPACSITGTTTLCPNGNGFLSGPPGMDAYAWLVSGNGSATSNASLPTVNIKAGALCGSNIVVVLTVTSNGCSSSCTNVVAVSDTTPPSVTCPTNFVVAETPHDSGSALVLLPSATATDGCGGLVNIYSSPASGSLFPIGSNTVTSTAVDSCGNSNSCTFNVRVIPYRLHVTTTADSGVGSLRQALLDANDSPDENLVDFNLPGSGPYALHLQSALPAILSPIIIDGWSQPGSNAPPVIDLDGSGGSNSFDGLRILAGNSTVRGLALHGFATAIRLETNGGNVIQGNFIGTDITTNPAPNTGDGIFISSSRNLIGGITNGAANLIAFNGSNGITLVGASNNRNRFLGNSIFSNGGLGIDLGADGITANDLSDSDAGPNASQNYPVLDDATSIDGVTTVHGSLTSAVGGPYRVEFFLNDSADPSGNGEGQRFLGAQDITLDQSGSNRFTVVFAISAKYTQFISATATDPANNTSEFSPAVQVGTPPVIEIQPVGTNIATGGSATLCATVSGTPPLLFQWRLNGINIPGATNQCVVVPSVQLAQGGTYTLCVMNGLGAVSSVTAPLKIAALNVPPGDNFAARVPLSGSTGLIEGLNLGATFENGEPLHAGKTGGKSVWYTWTPPYDGVATFRTLGSTFDTLLAVYSGTALTNLSFVDADEDRGGFYTSKTFFNAFSGVPYHIAIDGFAGAEGQFLLSWELENTPHLIPIFIVQPVSQTVAPGSTASFSALAVSVCGNGHVDCVDPDHYPGGNIPKLDYQWYFYGTAIPGATTNTLTITNVQTSNLGSYSLHVDTTWHTIESQDAVLQINTTGDGVEEVLAMDKLSDSDVGNALHIGVPPGGPVVAGRGLLAASIVRGFTGSQIFNTAGSFTGPTEIICGVVGGSSEWITFIADVSGTLFLNTDGSSYDTVMAVFRRSATNSSVLEQIVCDNNGGADGQDSAVALPVEAGKTNYVVVDGVNGATGILQLNYSLATTTVLKSVGVTAEGAQHLQVIGRTNLHFSIQRSTNMANWSTLITTNAPTGVFDFIDAGSTSSVRGFYRALLLP